MCICVLSVVCLSAMSTQYTAATIKLLESKRTEKRKQNGRNFDSGLVHFLVRQRKTRLFFVFPVISGYGHYLCYVYLALNLL